MTTSNNNAPTTTVETTATTKKKRASAKKKRKISKHILHAKKDLVELEKARETEKLPFSVVKALTDADDDDDTETTRDDAVTTSAAAASGSSKDKKQTSKKTGKANTQVKDVKEAAGYLTNWKQHRQQWKFNKNTQSWLTRHMYETDKIAKSTFVILLEYLQGLQGKGARDRILEEATRRALRYKQYSEESESDTKTSSGEKKENDFAKLVQFAEDTKAAADESKPKKAKSKKEMQDATDEEKRWNELSDHDKRKEYKRARKIIEALKD